MSFKDIKGQDIPVSFLKRAIENNSVAHAYLFVGVDGIGKGLAATTFAKVLNCEKGKSDSCDICSSCRKIENRNHPDIFWVAPDDIQKSVKINSIRTIQGKISLKPYEAKWKVCIIEDAHFMTPEAENCLLKTLEEPPPYSILILTTSNVSALFQTIISRCRIIKFYPLSSGIIEDILVKKFGFRKENAKFISRLSTGGMSKKATLGGEDFIIWKNRIVDEFMNGSFLKEESLLFSSSKIDLQEALSVLINWYRDILIYPECRNISRISSGSRRDSKEENFIRDKNDIGEASIINFDRVKDIARLSKEFSHEYIDRRLNILLDAHLAVKQNVNPKLIISTLT